MKEYFVLQSKMLNRKLIDFGMPLLLAYSLIPLAFILLSQHLFSESEFAIYVYIFLAGGFISKTSENKRNVFLKSIFPRKRYLTLRIFENVILSSPFLSFLMFKGQFLFVLALGVIAIFLVFFTFRTVANYTIPTPFEQKPFEFVEGFRNTFYLFPMAYFLTFMSISVNNFNLGVFSLVLVDLLCISYYSKPENGYFVWNFNVLPKTFLCEKIKTALAFFTLLALPIVVSLSITFFEDFAVLLVFLVLCNIYLAIIVLAKYSAYPYEMNWPEGLLIAVSLIFPPILLGIIPYFYFKSLKSLKLFLK